jgi:hypothetical protein
MTAADKTKLDGIATAATANSSDAALRDRATHTGEQAISTVTGLQTALDGKEAVLTAGTNVTIDRTDPENPVISATGDAGSGDVVGPASAVNNGVALFDGTTGKLIKDGGALGTAAFNATGDFAPASHVGAGGTAHADVIAAGASGFMTGADKTKLNGIATGANLYVHPNHSGDVTSVGDGAQTIAANAVTNAKAADMAVNTIKGRITAGTGDPEDLTAAQVRTIINDVLYAPVITESTTARNLALTDGGAYIRHTNASASTVTVPPQSSVTWLASTEIHIRRAAAGNLTLTPGAGVTLNAPSGGTLVMTNAMSVTLKRVASDEWDVIGQTVAA